MQPGRLGRFQILRELGKGAMGKVYLAYDPKIHRQVALKTISPGTSVPPERAGGSAGRILREAQACGRLLHPNIVTVFDVGEDRGLSFIAMEYVEGETLDIYTDPKTLLPIERILRIVAQACEALDYAHSHNIVHRDIKPANLLLMSGDQLKITDFGLAREPSSALTQNGMVLGTPFYMSPEQLAGKPVDGRSDLFSLGVVLYQLLTGVRPFPGESVSTIVYRILYEKPRAPKIVNEKLPIHFNTVLDRALAKDPADRFQAGAEFVKALEEYRSSYLQASKGAAFDPGRTTQPMPTLKPETGTPPAGNGKEPGRPPGRPAPARPGVPPRSAARPPAPRSKPGHPAPVPMLAGRPGKISFLGLSLIVCVFLFPRSFGTEPEAGGGFDRAGTAGGLPGIGSPADELRVWVTTDPPGGELTLDGEPIDGPSFLLSLGDDAVHRLVGRSGCRVGEQTVRVAERPEAIHLELSPEILSLEIGSNPEGADLIVDGERTGRRTPTRVELDRCRPHRVRLVKAGYYPWERTFEAGADSGEMEQALARATLRKIPNGYLQIPSPEGYTVGIFENGRRIGTSGERLTLPAGVHDFILRNERHFVEQRVRVEIEGRALREPQVDLPPLGFLTILALPSNCKIYVGERYLDIPPVVDYPIASGEYVIRAEYIPTGEIREERVVVEPGRQHRLNFRFEP